MIDSDREVEIGLGRGFSKSLLKANQAFATKSALKYLGIRDNGKDEIQLVFDISKYINFTSKEEFDQSELIQSIKNTDLNLYKSLSSAYDKIFNMNLFTFTLEAYILRINYTVIESFDSPNGKFADSYGNVLVIDAKHIIPEFLDSLKQNLMRFSKLKVDFNYLDIIFKPIIDIRIDDYALEVNAVLMNREEYYIHSRNKFKDEYIKRSIPLNMNITVAAPVNGALGGFQYIKLFLDSTLLTIVVFIVILSAMLIYSLMVSDIDERTYEMAMLRALGLRKTSIIHLILIQSWIFGVSGVAIGVIISGILNVLVR